VIICILDKNTKKVLNRVVVDSVDQYNPKDNEEVLANSGGNIGWVWNGSTFINQNLATDVRKQRNILLSETDWWACSDLTMTPEQIAYRQALRDLPQQVGFPDNVIFPTKPTQEELNG